MRHAFFAAPRQDLWGPRKKDQYFWTVIKLGDYYHTVYTDVWSKEFEGRFHSVEDADMHILDRLAADSAQLSDEVLRAQRKHDLVSKRIDAYYRNPSV